jgi:hypothetical protein
MAPVKRRGTTGEPSHQSGESTTTTYLTGAPPRPHVLHQNTRPPLPSPIIRVGQRRALGRPVTGSGRLASSVRRTPPSTSSHPDSLHTAIMQPASLRPDPPAGRLVPLPVTPPGSNGESEVATDSVHDPGTVKRGMQVPPHTGNRPVVRLSSSWPELSHPQWDRASTQRTKRSEERFESEQNQTFETVRSSRGDYDSELREARNKIRQLEEFIQLTETKHRLERGREIANIETRRMSDLEEHSKATRRLNEQLQEGLVREKKMIDAITAEEKRSKEQRTQINSLKEELGTERINFVEKLQACEDKIRELATDGTMNEARHKHIAFLEEELHRQERNFEKDKLALEQQVQKASEQRQASLQKLADIKEKFVEMTKLKEEETRRMRQNHDEAAQTRLEKKRYEGLCEENLRERASLDQERKEWQEFTEKELRRLRDYDKELQQERKDFEEARNAFEANKLQTLLQTQPQLSPVPTASPSEQYQHARANPSTTGPAMPTRITKDYAQPPFPTPDYQPLTMSNLQKIINAEVEKLRSSLQPQPQPTYISHERPMESSPPPSRRVPPTQAPGHTWTRPFIKMNLPTFKGEGDSPFNFLNRFERYAQSQQIDLDTALATAMPCALEDKADIWWRFCRSTKNNQWADFKEEFLKMFGPPDYYRQLERELDLRTQGPGELLTSFIANIHEYYVKLNSTESNKDRVSRVIRQMHPSYKPYMWQRQFRDLHEMMEYAHDVQASLHLDKAYKPPPAPSESVDPSLAYRPTRADQRAQNQHQLDSGARPQVRFNNEEPRPASRERRDYSKERASQFDANKLIKSPREDVATRDRSRDRDQSRERRERDTSRDRSGSCFVCGKTDHWANECPDKEKNGGSIGPHGNPTSKNQRSPSRQ